MNKKTKINVFYTIHNVCFSPLYARQEIQRSNAQSVNGRAHPPKSSQVNQISVNLRPESVQVLDESPMHAGHREAKGGETHFRIAVVSPLFAGKSGVERHQMVYSLVTDEFALGLHAIVLRLRAPGEQ